MMNEKKTTKHTGGKQALCRILAALAVLALLVGIVLPGLGEEAEKPAAIPELPEYFKEWVEVPELTDRLVPLDLSCEKDGIRLEVTWGAATDIGALFIYTMQDLQGARFEPNTAMRLDMLPVDDWFSGFTVLDVNNNRKFTMAAFYSYESPETVTKDNVMTLGVRALDIHEEKHLDIRGLLDKYGSRAKFTEVPELRSYYYLKSTDLADGEFYTAEDYRNAGLKVLDYTDPISVRLHKNVVLTGIGMLDECLHIQLRYVNNDPVLIDGIEHKPISSVYITNSNGFHLTGPEYPLPVPIMLDTGDGTNDETEEFILPWDSFAQETEGIRVNIVENTEILEGNWQVRVPLESVWVGDPAYLENK